MADFEPCYLKMVKDEGGFRLSKLKNDSGGLTFAGISRNNWPNWEGWALVDRGDRGSIELSKAVRDFYYKEFWVKMKCDGLPQDAANLIFNFGVNASDRVAVKLAQLTVGTVPDGVMGPKTQAAITIMDSKWFRMAYTLAKIARYNEIVAKKPGQKEYLHGWISRALGML